ncbi:zinc finger protein 512B isoform X2 [Pleurodeles waltl]|uniref:zinc finger protein 512B isoform X2 n=1 Tax=Pleurodeles waltl TaxID=8319 RepID=UPI003709496E
MANTYYGGGRRRGFAFSKTRAPRESPGRDPYGHSGYEPPRMGSSGIEKTEGKKKGRPKSDNLDLRDIPGAFSEKLTYSCRFCKAVFASKTRLEKHRAWNHPDKQPTDIRAWNQVQKLPDRGSSTKRFSESAISFTKHTKQARMEKLLSKRRPENGEFMPETHGCKESRRSVVDIAESYRELKQDGGSLSPEEEEDPERMRHRRKQKTPKKFTGEQPSISGTFGLKGLLKAEEKGKAGRPMKLEGFSQRAEIRRRPLGLSARREVAIYTPGSIEDKWQREIAEKGEVLCSNCKCVTRKTILGLRKHMDVCQKLQDALKCQHCRKQFKSKAGLSYHTMAEHINKPDVMHAEGLSEIEERERLRKVLKQLGKLKCPNEGCAATFTSLMGYQYHQKRCGKEPSELEKPVFACRHCEKTYKSKAGHDYHVRSEHTVPSEEPQENLEDESAEDFERTPSGRIRRRSAQVAVFHLQEIAEDELAKDWNKRRMKDDLVPDTKLLNYIRPGLPTFHPRLLENWKNEVKEQGQIMCPNHCCQAIYSSVSGLKAHLASCNKGELSIGKYRCLLCFKEFSSESGVKYHILKTHSQNWFRTSIGAVSTRKYQEPDSKIKERQKSTPGKKRGRKPKQRLLLNFPGHGQESVAAKTNHHKSVNATSWEVSNSRSSESREKINMPFGIRRGLGTSKLPEK